MLILMFSVAIVNAKGKQTLRWSELTKRALESHYLCSNCDGEYDYSCECSVQHLALLPTIASVKVRS